MRRLSGFWAGAIALAAITLLVFGQVAGHAFLQFDDADYVTGNPMVRHGLTWGGIVAALTSSHAGNWHPLTWLSHMVDVELFGLQAGRHLLVNVMLHGATSVLLFALLVRLTRRIAPSLFVSALFAIHPLHVESVAWVAERKDVLSTFWWVLTIGAYVRYVERKTTARYAAVVLLFALALLSKAMVVTLPVLLLLLDVWPLGRLSASGVREKLPLVSLAAIVAVMTFIVQRQAGAVQSIDAFPWALRLANVPVAYATYLFKTFWPASLSPLYLYPDAIPAWQIAGSAALLAVITWVAVRARTSRPYILVGWTWFLVTLVPVIGLVQVGSQPFADRYMYVPAIGIFLAVAWTAVDLAGRSATRRVLARVAGAAVVTVLAVVSHRQAGVWRDSVTLWEHAVSVGPDNYRAHTNLGFALAEADEIDRAIAAYREAIRLRPGFPNAHNYLGALLSQRGRHAEAAVELRAALKTRPRFVEARNNLGLALAALDQPGDAIGEFREAVRLDPTFAPAWNNLGIVLAGVGQIEAAVQAFTESVRYQPESAQAHYNLGVALRDAGRPAEARIHFESALRIDPGFQAARDAIK